MNHEDAKEAKDAKKKEEGRRRKKKVNINLVN
jgi:hypothetical protein